MAPNVDFDINYELGNFIIISGCYVRSAINNVSSRYKEETTVAIYNNFFYFNPETVNLYPCIFNMMVDLYQHCLSLDLHIYDPKIDIFKDSYDYESLNGINHFVDGKIYCHANNISNLIKYFQSKVSHCED